jgi:GNAT superfamily N-acetyltransferase
MQKADLTPAIENNLFEVWEFLSAIPQVDYHGTPKMIRYISGVLFPLCNNIMRANFPAEDLDRQIKEALAPIKSRQLPMFWWIGPATRPVDLGRYLEKEGLNLAEHIPGMAADLDAIKTNPVDPPGLVIREVKDLTTLGAWLEVFRTGFEMPDVVVDFFGNAMSQIGFHPDLRYKHYLGLWKDKPVACSSVYLGDDAAGIYNVATLAAFRGRGIGSFMTRWPLLLAKERGFRVGILHATSMGIPVYEKMGFKECCRLAIYHWQP